MLASTGVVPCLGAVPQQWNLTLVARLGDLNTTVGGLPPDAAFTNSGKRASGVPNNVGLDEQGNVAIRYNYNFGGSVAFSRVLYYNAQTKSASHLAQQPWTRPPSSYSLYDETMSCSNGRFMLRTDSSIVPVAEVYDQQGRLVRQMGSGGPLSASQFRAMRLRRDTSIGYSGSATNSTGTGSTLQFLIDAQPNPADAGTRTQRVLATAEWPISPYTLLSPPVFLDQDDVAISKVYYRDDFTTALYRFRLDPQTGQRVEEKILALRELASQGYDSLNDACSVNSAGQAVFTVRNFNAGSPKWELRTSTSGIGSLIIRGGTTSFENSTVSNLAPRINARGQILYGATKLDGSDAGSAIWMTDGTTTRRVAFAGQELTVPLPNGGTQKVTLGSNAVDGKIYWGPLCLNDNGQVAFLAQFTDQTQGIILATPVSLACNPADITDASGAGQSDGQLTGSDVLAFFTDFFAGIQPGVANRADITDVSGTGGPDGTLGGSDIVAFFSAFFAGCPGQ